MTVNERLNADAELKQVANRAKHARIEGEALRRSQSLSPSGKAMFETYPGRKALRIDHVEEDGRIILVGVRDTNPVNRYRVYGLYRADNPEQLIYCWTGSRNEQQARGTVKLWLNRPDAYDNLKRAMVDTETGEVAQFKTFTLKTGTQAQCKEFVSRLKKEKRPLINSLDQPPKCEVFVERNKKVKDAVRAQRDLVRIGLCNYVEHLGYDKADVDDIFWAMWKICDIDEIVQAIQAHYGIDPNQVPDYDGIRPGCSWQRA